MVMQKYPDGTKNRDMLDAITYVLIENGFEIAMINESYGLVNTSYRKVISGTDTALSVVSIFAAAMSKTSSSYSTFEREMMISIQVLDNGYKVIPKIKRISNTRSLFSTSSQDNVEYPTSDSAEGGLVNKIIHEINHQLRIIDDYEWTEKEISISDTY